MAAAFNRFKRFVFWNIILTALGWILSVLFHLWIFPAIFDSFLKTELSLKRHLSVQYETVSLSFDQGLVIKNLNIQKSFRKELLVLNLKEIQIKVDFLHWLRSREWLIDLPVISQGQLRYERRGILRGDLHFDLLSGFLRKASTGQGFKGWQGALEMNELSSRADPIRAKRLNIHLGCDGMRWRTRDFFWKNYPIKFEGVIGSLLLKPKIFGEFSGQEGHLFFSLENKFLCAQLFSGSDLSGHHGTKVLLKADFQHGFCQPLIWMNGTVKPSDLQALGFWNNPVLEKAKLSRINFRCEWIGLDFLRFGNRGWGEFDLKTPAVTLRSFLFQDLKLKLCFEQGQFFLKHFHCKAYEGRIQGKGWLSSRQFYGGDMTFQGIRLDLLSPLFLRGGQRLEGQMRGKINLVGTGFEKDQFKAEGLFNVDQGNLWKIDLMKKVLKAFKAVFPSLGSVRFTSCKAHFFVGAGILHLDEFKMLSSVMVMKIKGTLNLLQKSLNFHLMLSLKPGGLKDKTFLSKVITSGLMVSGQQVWQIKIGGTFENPEVTPLFLSIFDPVKELIKSPLRLFKKVK